jgi:hypothetical protein
MKKVLPAKRRHHPLFIKIVGLSINEQQTSHKILRVWFPRCLVNFIQQGTFRAASTSTNHILTIKISIVEALFNNKVHWRSSGQVLLHGSKILQNIRILPQQQQKIMVDQVAANNTLQQLGK